MTKTIEKKRKRNLPRGILTPTEEERLRKGNISRQLAYNIRRKTNKTIIVDLPLIFDTIGIEGMMYPYVTKQYLQKTLNLYFNLIKKKIEDERRQRGVRRKVSSKQVWSRIRKEMGDAEKEHSINNKNCLIKFSNIH